MVPSELGTNLNAVRCPECGKANDGPGYLLPSDGAASTWRCHSCHFTCGKSLVAAMLEKIEQRIARAKHKEDIFTLLSELEDNHLHRDHILLFTLKEKLVFDCYQVKS